MLPLIVLRRLDAVLEPTKKAVLEAKAKYEAMGLEGDAFEKAIAKVAIGGDRGIKNAKSKSNNFLPRDGHPDKQFHYMFANPPFGVEWKPEQEFIDDEAANRLIHQPMRAPFII